MDLVTGAVGSLASKLLQLLWEEYKPQTGLNEQLRSLLTELECLAAFLDKVSGVPWYKLDKRIKDWAREARDKCYDAEDIFDTFLVHFEGSETAHPGRLRRAMHKMGDLFTKGKAQHDIANDIERIMKELIEVAARHRRYKIGNSIEAKPAAPVTDPRLPALYPNPSLLVGINEPRDALIQILSVEGQEKKIVSIVGSGGLGKTTLAKAVYDKIINVNKRFDFCAFVKAGQDPDIKKILRDILTDLKITNMIDALVNESLSFGNLNQLDERQLLDRLRERLAGKRYFIVVDDIWETKTWRCVNPAFVDGNCGSRILTTTRNSEVSKEIGEVYRLEELSDNNSKKLFYSITFGGEEKRPRSDELDKVSRTIIQKCRGVPLSIITIAGVLARKSIEEWANVYDSISFGHDENIVDDMKKILSFSYYDLPSHLRTCLLYLSIFPEDIVIEERELILRWIAEGFIREESGKVSFDVGRSYLRQLIDRNLVIPVVEKRSGLLQGCRVHDMLLRLIRQLSTEENFVVALDKEQRSSVEENNVRRLALRMLTEETNYKDMARVRSFNALICFTKMIPPVCSFKVLRVLVLEYCIGMEDYPIEHIANLLHLRYIGLSHTPVRKLPEEIGHLKFLQTLLLDDTGIKELPASVRLLKQLMCLRVDENTRVPDWIGEMTSLVELEMYHELAPNFVIRESPRIQEQEMHRGADNQCSTKQFVKKLGNLINLSVLKSGIKLQDQEEGIYFLASLGKLHMIQDISILLTDFLELEIDVGTEPSLFALSSSLRTLELFNIEFSKLPAWMNGQRLPNLCRLKVMVSDADEQDLRNLGTLRELRDLVLVTTRNHRLKLTICGCSGFQNLRFIHIAEPLQFVPGAMPRLENITLSVTVFELKYANISFDFGLENLSSLQSVIVGMDCADAFPIQVEEAEAALRHAVDIHSNHPLLLVKRSNEDKMRPVGAGARTRSQRMYKQIKKLNDRIDVQNNCNSTLYSQAQEMAHSIPEGHPSIAKIQWSSVSMMEMEELRKNLADAFERMNDTSDPDQLKQHILLQERLLELYNFENKRMAAIVEELKAALQIIDNVTNAEGKGEQTRL